MEASMPTRKLRLSRAEQAESYVRLRQLQAEGIDVDVPDGWRERCPLKITQGRQPGMVCDLGGGNTGYAIWVRVVSQGRVIVPDYEISAEWDEGSIDLPYLRETDGRYKFGCLDYAVTEVLNDQLERGLRFNFRGDMVEGVIIAYGCLAIPETYHGAVSVRVTLMDALERTVQAELELLVGERVSKRDQRPVRPGGGLYIPDERENTNPPTLPKSSAAGQRVSGL
jgi:hypothetical protein